MCPAGHHLFHCNTVYTMTPSSHLFHTYICSTVRDIYTQCILIYVYDYEYEYEYILYINRPCLWHTVDALE